MMMSASLHSPGNDDRKAIDDAAEMWFGRRDGGLTAAQEEEFAAWLGADPRHRRAFARFTAGSRVFDRLAEFRPAAAAAPDPTLRLRPARPAVIRPAAWPRISLAAAAAFALAYAGWRIAPHPADPEEWRAPGDAPFAQVARTEIGRLRNLTLPDGSRVTLNSDTAVTIAFSATARRVRLDRGEAHFTVARNPARPFVVEAGGVAVRAVGTEFNVRLLSRKVDVLVTEGRVRVDDAAKGRSLLPAASASWTAAPPAAESERVLGAGERAIVSRADVAAPPPAVVVVVPPAEAVSLLAWQERRLEFDPTPLSEVAAEFNRYNRHKLIVADAAIRDLKVGGAFPVDDYPTFVRLLESSFGVSAERREHETLLRKAP